jgi:hypothetical protein
VRPARIVEEKAGERFAEGVEDPHQTLRRQATTSCRGGRARYFGVAWPPQQATPIATIALSLIDMASRESL